MPSHQRQSSAEVIDILRNGDVSVVGRLPWSSNFTFLVDVQLNENSVQAVYKPLEGEQDLWDFPEALYKREIAAYELSNALGWPNIPPTIERSENMPIGVGSLQLFIPADFEHHYFTLAEDEKHMDDFKRIAAFDLIANNTDRKSGHCLLGQDENIYAIDNGLCFHEHPKLRTVIWEFQGQLIPHELINDIERVRNDLPESLSKWLNEQEISTLFERMDWLISEPVFPPLTSERQYPWPLV